MRPKEEAPTWRVEECVYSLHDTNRKTHTKHNTSCIGLGAGSLLVAVAAAAATCVSATLRHTAVRITA